MKTALTIELLNQSVSLPDLTIGQAIDIVQIPQAMNEQRLSAFIAHLTGDTALAGTLTVQERYYILLSHQAISYNRYSAESNIDDFLLETVQADVPASMQVGDIHISHLLGAHVCVLEGVCENVYDWLTGQVACQVSGDLCSIIGGTDEALNWTALPSSMTEAELNAAIQARIVMISALSVDSFNELLDAYNIGVSQLNHFVVLGCENEGLNLITQGGAGIDEPARFLTLDGLQGTAARLAKCFIG